MENFHSSASASCQLTYDQTTPYIYCWIRKDLPIVQQIVQTAHACDQMALQLAPYANGPAHLILFEAMDEKHLLEISRFLNQENIDHEMFYEPDGPNPGYTAIATAPQIGEERAKFANFKLYVEQRPHIIDVTW